MEEDEIITFLILYVEFLTKKQFMYSISDLSSNSPLRISVARFFINQN
jgi:hypothetical protein